MLTREELKRKIQINYDMIHEAEGWIADEKDIERRLRIISCISLLYATHVTGVYSSFFLENEISKIGQSIKINDYKVPDNGHILHVLTKGAIYGGHSTLACNFIKWDRKHVSSIVFTDMGKDEITGNFTEAVRNSGGYIYTLSGGYIDRARELIRISKQFEAIVLHMHMNDVIPGLAYSNKNWKTPVFFCNHADFRFSLGFTMADKLLNITYYDIEKNRSYRGIERGRNLFLFFPDFSDIGSSRLDENIYERFGIPTDRSIIVSMGADYKYHSVLEWNFYDFALKLLDIKKDAIFVVIGADPENDEWNKVREKSDGRIFALGILKPGDAESMIAGADLYISSFPMVASGAKVAQKHGVPNLTLTITGRGKEYYGRDAVDNVEDLLKRSIEILESDGSVFVSENTINDFTQQKWEQDLYDLLDSVKDHHTYTISPRRVIGQQELIDYEMMERDAEGWASAFLWENRDDYKLLEKIYHLQERWKKAIIPTSYIARIGKEMFVRNKLYERMLKWNRACWQLKYGLSEYFEMKDEYRVAIYGYGDIGKLLLQKMKLSSVNVVCCIDKSVDGKSCPISIYIPSRYEDMYAGELVINTTIYDDEIIRQEFSTDSIRITSIDKVLDDILERDQTYENGISGRS